MTIKAGLIDDQELVQVAVKDILGRDREIDFVGIFDNAGMLLESGEELDVLLLGGTLPLPSLLTTVARLSETRPHLRLIVLGRQWTASTVQTALECGATGVMDRDEKLNDLLAIGVHRVYDGDQFLSPAIALVCANAPQDNPLTERELEILKLMAQGGLDPQRIAVTLKIKRDTVYKYRRNILDKLDVQTNEQAVHEAIRRGLI
ncbi:MAG TPA: response regulator transcription factor [Bellilinea sp.]|nr:response regulator transcription factor [Bellilinea sp.]